MPKPEVRTTLQEDFAKLGLPNLAGEAVRIAGITESVEAPETPVVESDDKAKGAVVCDKCDKPKSECTCDEEETTEDVNDPIDGKFATKELFDRIRNLPFEAMSESDHRELLDRLGDKEIPDSDTALRQEAEEIVKMIQESMAVRGRRHKEHSMSMGKPTYRCEMGKRQVDGGGSVPKCVPSHMAVDGGVGGLRAEARAKRIWSRGSGRASVKRSAAWSQRRSDELVMSPLAMELAAVAEGVDESKAPYTVREEIIERVVAIVGFLSEEFADVSVSKLYSEAVERMIDTYDAGRLDEDVANDDEFVAELEGVLGLITKSISKLEDREEQGNV